jgi:hypothetical protein
VKAGLAGAPLIALLVAACGGDRFRVTDGPVVVGPVAQTFAPPRGLPLHDPRNAITVWLGHAFDRGASRLYDDPRPALE